MNSTFYEGLIEAQDYMANMPAESISLLVAKCFIAIVLNIILGRIYILYGSSFSDRKNLASGFLILSLTTMLLITVVKSSLALSLGLVGALSIVRFRTPIKEPEDLLYLFFSIAIGLGLGANQIMVTCLMAGVIMILLIILGNIRDRSLNIDGTTLTIEVQGHHDIGSYITVLSAHCNRVSLSCYEYGEDRSTIVFDIEVDDATRLELIKAECVKCSGDDVKLAFVDSQYGRVF